MMIEYAFFWFLGAVAFLGWPISLYFAISNRNRLVAIEKIMKGMSNA